ncbi:MAG: hypothetical protein OXI73_11015 [Rhodospirillales bacterium]|nr:hypothetical protein [Rhodospirillales bacterium]
MIGAAPHVSATATVRQTGVDRVFPGPRFGRPLADFTPFRVLRAIGLPGAPRGRRAAFHVVGWPAEHRCPRSGTG